MPGPTISIIINNYNYGRYLRQCIESVLRQTVQADEIILIDDGSTDNSLEIAREFADRVRIVAKQNGGQASAFNEGLKVSHGDWLWFLDSDDWLKPEAVEKMKTLIRPGTSKIHCRLELVDEKGKSLHKSFPDEKLSEGNVVTEIREKGVYIWPPTSANLFQRSFLEKCMPIPEDTFRLCADLYLCNQAAFSGNIIALHEELAYYRMHGSNNFAGNNLDPKRLRNQALNLITARELLTSLFRENLDISNYTFPFTRWNFETLLLAERFSGFSVRDQFGENNLFRAWQSTPEVKTKKFPQSLLYRLYWSFLRYSPKKVIERFYGRKK